MLLFCFWLALGTALATDLPQGDWTKHGFTATQRQELRGLLRDAAATKEISGGAFLLIH